MLHCFELMKTVFETEVFGCIGFLYLRMSTVGSAAAFSLQARYALPRLRATVRF